jgi:hypothetical protein
MRTENPYNLLDNIEFGQYRGQSIKNIMDMDIGYINRCLEEIEWFDLDTETYHYFDRAYFIWN